MSISSNSSTSNSKGIKSSRTLSTSHLQQIRVLQILSKSSSNKEHPKFFEIAEIAELSGSADEREIQRQLLILEGQKLVAPNPEGDFTSTRWHITGEGIRAVKTISKAMVQ